MKKTYVQPTLILSEFSTEDVMSLSAIFGDGDTYKLDLPM